MSSPPSQPKQRRGLRELLRCTVGSASTEAVVMLPFFVIVWGCIIYVSNRYERSVDISQDARKCAWQHVMSACENDVECPLADGANLADADFAGGATGYLDALGGDLPFVDWMFEGLFGKDITASASTSTTAPTVAGGGSRHIAGAMALTCNERPRGDLGDILHDAFCTLSPWCP